MNLGFWIERIGRMKVIGFGGSIGGRRVEMGAGLRVRIPRRQLRYSGKGLESLLAEGEGGSIARHQPH
jgi:hypothetical protein